MVSKLKTGKNQNQYFRVAINRKGHKIDKLFFDMKSAKAFEEITRKAIDDGTYIDEDSRLALIPTVKTLLEDYFNLIKENNKKAVAYKYTVKNKEFKLLKQIPNRKLTLIDMVIDFAEYRTIKPYTTNDAIPFGDFYADCVDTYLIERYIANLRENEELKEGSIHTELLYIKGAFKVVNRLYPHLKSDKIIINNPFDALTKEDLPKRSPPRKKIVPEEHISKVINYFSSKANKQYLLAFKICLETGVRKNECLSILLENIDRVKKKIYIPMTKNGTDRTIYVSEEVIAMLPEATEGKLFSITPYAINQMWYRCFEKTPKQERPQWHSLKNTAISRAVSENSNYKLAEKFRISQETLKQFLQDEELIAFIQKRQSGEALTDEEVQKFVGGHKSNAMTQRYFVDTENK